MVITNFSRKAYSYISWPPVTIGRKMFTVIGSIDKSWFFLNHLVVQTLLALSSNYILFNLKNEINQGFGKLDSALFSNLSQDNATEQDWIGFRSQGINVLQPVCVYIAVSLITESAETIYEKWIAKKIKQKLTAKVFNDNQVGINLANSEETAAIVRHLPSDIEQITSDGLKLVKKAAKTTQDASLSIMTLIRLSSYIDVLSIKVPDLLLISVSYSAVKQTISLLFTNKATEFYSAQAMQDTKTTTIIAHDFSNVKPIFTAGAQNSVSERHAIQMDKADNLRTQYQLINSAHSIWMNLTGFSNLLFRHLVTGHKVFRKLIKGDEIYATFSHFGNVDNFLSWPDTNQAKIKQFEPSLDRVQIFLTKEKEIIEHKPEIIYNRALHLSIKNLTLIVDNKVLFNIPQMTFEPGKRYVFSGKSGSGKSSLIAKINGIIHDGIDAKGIIAYPRNMRKKMMLTQDDYFPAHASILDVICLPGKAPADEIGRAEVLSQIKTLLEEVYLGRELDVEQEKTNWSAELSGGQKKKVKVVSAIIQKPDLLLLDEIFVGLDKASIILMQAMLDKYLPKTTIISVDHHSDDGKNFYDSHHTVNQELKTVQHVWGDNALKAKGRARQ